MSTWHHHWLAESFFPGDKIAEVLDAIDKNQNVIGGADALKPSDAETTQPADKEVNDDILRQKSLVVGGEDYAGNTVLINMDGIGRELAIRILDYIKGALQVVGGMMTKVGKTTLVVAPKNVDVSSIEAMVGGSEG